MSVENLRSLREKAGVPDDEIAKRMGIRPDQYQTLLSGDGNFRRLYVHALDKASLLLALEQRRPELLTPLFQKQLLRIAVMILQSTGTELEKLETAKAPAAAVRKPSRTPDGGDEDELDGRELDLD